jgi:hypothetical protein
MTEITIDKVIAILLDEYPELEIFIEKQKESNYIYISVRGETQVGSSFYDLDDGVLLGTEVEWTELFEKEKEEKDCLFSEELYEMEKDYMSKHMFL